MTLKFPNTPSGNTSAERRGNKSPGQNPARAWKSLFLEVGIVAQFIKGDHGRERCQTVRAGPFLLARACLPLVTAGPGGLRLLPRPGFDVAVGGIVQNQHLRHRALPGSRQHRQWRANAP